MARDKSESRFGFGQLVASAGVVLLGVGVSQPWLRLDLPRAFAEAVKPERLDAKVANDVLFVLSSEPLDKLKGTPQATQLARELGIGATGWDQNHWLAAAVVAAGVIALLGVVRSVTASSAWAARSYSPLLALAGLASLAAAAVSLWLVSPQPRAAMRPDAGLWLIVAGAVLLLLGALTLGNNRRRPWIDELEADQPMKQSGNTEHLAYSHGAWVPKLPDDRER